MRGGIFRIQANRRAKALLGRLEIPAFFVHGVGGKPEMVEQFSELAVEAGLCRSEPHRTGHWGFGFMGPLRFYEDATEQEIGPCILFVEANRLTRVYLGGRKIAVAPALPGEFQILFAQTVRRVVRCVRGFADRHVAAITGQGMNALARCCRDWDASARRFEPRRAWANRVNTARSTTQPGTHRW
jgi:hypothetical protein